MSIDMNNPVLFLFTGFAMICTLMAVIGFVWPIFVGWVARRRQLSHKP